MIILFFYSLTDTIFKFFLTDTLPLADPIIIAKLNEAVSFFVSKFLMLGNYYLPMDIVRFWCTTIICAD